MDSGNSITSRLNEPILTTHQQMDIYAERRSALRQPEPRAVEGATVQQPVPLSGPQGLCVLIFHFLKAHAERKTDSHHQGLRRIGEFQAQYP
jgi:hypothetical protein